MGNIIYNKDLLTNSIKKLKSKKSILFNINLPISNLQKEKQILLIINLIFSRKLLFLLEKF